jgi:hypothetical protein
MKTLLCQMMVFLIVGGMLLVLVDARETENSSNVRVQYYEVLVQIAEVDLQIAAESNRKVRGSFPGQTIQRLQTNVDVARKLHERATLGYGDMPEAHVLYAEARAQLSENNYRSAIKVRELDPNSMGELKLEKIRLSAELARLRLVMWKHPESLSSLVDHMQWEIDQLSQEILELHRRVERLE